MLTIKNLIIVRAGEVVKWGGYDLSLDGTRQIKALANTLSPYRGKGTVIICGSSMVDKQSAKILSIELGSKYSCSGHHLSMMFIDKEKDRIKKISVLKKPYFKKIKTLILVSDSRFTYQFPYDFIKHILKTHPPAKEAIDCGNAIRIACEKEIGVCDIGDIFHINPS